MVCANVDYRYVQPWIDDKRLMRTRIGNWIILGLFALGVCLSAYIMYTGAVAARVPDVSHDPMEPQLVELTMFS